MLSCRPVCHRGRGKSWGEGIHLPTVLQRPDASFGKVLEVGLDLLVALLSLVETLLGQSLWWHGLDCCLGCLVQVALLLIQFPTNTHLGREHMTVLSQVLEPLPLRWEPGLSFCGFCLCSTQPWLLRTFRERTGEWKNISLSNFVKKKIISKRKMHCFPQ